MGLHNLESVSLTELNSEAFSSLEASQSNNWIDDVLEMYSSIPEAPLGTEAEVVKHLLTGLRNMYFNSAKKKYIKDAGLLLKAIEQNSHNRYALYLELVKEVDFEATLQKYTVWKGTLFDTHIEGQLVVVWHPDKDFKPIHHGRILRTGYSELGRRQRRRETRPK